MSSYLFKVIFTVIFTGRYAGSFSRCWFLILAFAITMSRAYTQAPEVDDRSRVETQTIELVRVVEGYGLHRETIRLPQPIALEGVSTVYFDGIQVAFERPENGAQDSGLEIFGLAIEFLAGDVLLGRGQFLRGTRVPLAIPVRGWVPLALPPGERPRRDRPVLPDNS